MQLPKFETPRPPKPLTRSQQRALDEHAYRQAVDRLDITLARSAALAAERRKRS